MMLTVADRIGESGPRALVAREGGAEAPARTHPKRRTAAARRSSAWRMGTLAAGIALWLGIGATPAHAAQRTTLSVAQAGVDTLPLLAAMGIGIVVAAIAVIAFLQMTTKARYGKEEEWMTEEKQPGWPGERSSAERGSTGRDRAERAPGGRGAGERDSAELVPADRAPAERGSTGRALTHQASESGRGAAAVSEDEPRAALPEDPSSFTIPLPAVNGRRVRAAAGAADSGPRLRGLEGQFEGGEYPVTEEWLTLGRDASQCGLAFPCDAGEVSRRHCSLRFERDRGVFLLEDHGSSNGTFLSGGERLDPGIAYELRPGSRFSLSGSRHWFEVQL